jgi:UDP-2,3-diacylglucosamine hydrolase
VSPGDVVVFAGDIFDLMVGNSSFYRTKYSAFFDRVARLADLGVSLHYIEGNHDFHLSDLFPASVQFHPESVELTLSSGKRAYIAHGDLADPSDTGYLRLRGFFRSTAIFALSRVLPGRVIEGLSRVLSRDETLKAADLPDHWPVAERDRLRAVYRTFAAQQKRQGFDFVVLGHCHDLDEEGGFYWNMGYPPVHRQFLYWESPLTQEKDSLIRRNFLGI